LSPTAASGRTVLAARIAVARAVTAASLASLAAAITAGILSGDTPALLLMPALLPLLIFVPAVYHARPRGLAFLCFVCLLYFCVIVTRLFAPDADLFDAAALIAVITLFIAAMLCSRWRRNRPGA
jgi:uncharacterized membrane protein